MDNVNYNDELVHWGIKGMRWGVRRYQNKDGSLTPAGQKRYDDEMNKTNAKIAKIEAKNKAKADAAARKQNLKNAKAKLKALKRGKTADDKPDANESDDQKKARILEKPTAKDVIENRHLFSNKEIGDLWVRLNNESQISKLIPDEEALQKAKRDKFFNNLENAAGNINKAAKLYNTFANIYNAFGKNEISLPKIDLDNTKGNRNQRKQEKKALKEAKEKAAAAEKAKRDAEKAKRDAEKQAKEEMRKYRERQKNWQETDGGPPKSKFSEYFKRTGEKTRVRPDNTSTTSASTGKPAARLLLGGSTSGTATSRQTVENRITSMSVYNSPVSTLSKRSVSNGQRYVADSNLLGDGVIDLYDDGTGRFSMR